MSPVRSLIPILLCMLVAACGGRAPDDVLYRPSGTPLGFDFKRESSFEAYLKAHIAHIRRNRVFLDPGDAEAELARVVPYELPVPAHCPGRDTKGALLVHGMSDTAFGLRDIAARLGGDCVLARGILLPGHGTRPGDLIDITKEDWIDAVDFGIRSLKGDVDHVYVVGFSLGGLLAVDAAMEHGDLAGLVLLSPSLEIFHSGAVWQTVWLRYFREWIDIDPNDNPVSYEAAPTNLLAELTELKSHTARSLRKDDIAVPVLSYFSQHDWTVDSVKTMEALGRATASGDSRFIYYGDGARLSMEDDRIEYRNSFLPEDRVLNFSHISFSFSPENPFFGRDGSMRICGENLGMENTEEARLCRAHPDPWKGELQSTTDEGYLPLQRLMFNPDFDAMMGDIADFMAATANESGSR